MLPDFVIYETPEEYKCYYEEIYCKAPTLTFDGIKVFFSKDKFDHAFFESTKRNGVKDIFSEERAKRIDWIKATLENPKADLYQGWDKDSKKYFPHRRVSVVFGDFAVIIGLSLNKKNGELKGNFITCYEADNSIGKIRISPVWDKQKCLDCLK